MLMPVVNKAPFVSRVWFSCHVAHLGIMYKYGMMDCLRDTEKGYMGCVMGKPACGGGQYVKILVSLHICSVL